MNNYLLNADEIQLDLLKNTLQFNPENRFCIDDVLNHEYFNEVRNK